MEASVAEALKRGLTLKRLGDAIVVMASEEFPLVVTDTAVHRIRVLQQKENRPAASLRLRIIAGGCSGMQYRMDLADAPRTNDLVVSAQDVHVFVDPKSMTYLKGSKLEWEEDLFGGQFKITNPNAKHSCSCGLSFTI
jgi:iron-sulfur cluster assembly protein